MYSLVYIHLNPIPIGLIVMNPRSVASRDCPMAREIFFSARRKITSFIFIYIIHTLVYLLSVEYLGGLATLDQYTFYFHSSLYRLGRTHCYAKRS